jgi:RsiW-degrading membrane proteinase PrsW (M82 family)
MSSIASTLEVFVRKAPRALFVSVVIFLMGCTLLLFAVAVIKRYEMQIANVDRQSLDRLEAVSQAIREAIRKL